MNIRRSIAYKLVLFLLLAAILPLALYGMISLWQARATAKSAVVVGNHRIAERAADQINQYVVKTLGGARLVGEDINHPDLKDWQRQRTLRTVVLEFPEYRELTIFNVDGSVESSSAVGKARLASNRRIAEAIAATRRGQSYFSDVFITDELTPAIVAAFPMEQLGEVVNVIAVELDLLHMWRLVGKVKIGDLGYLNVVLPDGKLVASGSGELKKLVLQEKDYPAMGLIRSIIALGTDNPGYSIRESDQGNVLLSVAQLPQPLEWIAVVEQPADEAYALTRRMSWQLIALVSIFVILVSLIGYFGGRGQILEPIKALIGGTRAVSKGDLGYRVSVHRSDEFGELATAFNQMTGDLMQAQDNIRRQERMATFGRIASGLVHDLKHPVKSIENASRLMDRMYSDPEYRKTFVKTVDREFEKINSFLSNLHTLTHDIPYHPIRLKLKPLLNDVVETFRQEADKNKVSISIDVPDENGTIRADKISISRALSNIVINGIQAMPEGGSLAIEARPYRDEGGEWIRLQISDTGCGIPSDRLKTIFGDFVTTKRRGLGLGLALTKRILDQHGARVAVRSEVGTGTTFDIKFPVPQ